MVYKHNNTWIAVDISVDVVNRFYPFDADNEISYVSISADFSCKDTWVDNDRDDLKVFYRLCNFIVSSVEVDNYDHYISKKGTFFYANYSLA